MIYTIAFDPEKKQPGCVLLQKAMGASIPNNVLLKYFDTHDWLLAPTPGLTLFPLESEEQLVSLSWITKNREGADG